MNPLIRLLGIAVVFCITTVCWLMLAGVMESRTYTQNSDLRGAVSELWGSELDQRAPFATSEWIVQVEKVEKKRDGEREWTETRMVPELRKLPGPLARSRITSDLTLDERRKGLVWYPLYDVAFAGDWTFTHDAPDGELVLTFPFPHGDNIYDDFRFVVDGVAQDVQPSNGQVVARIPATNGQVVNVQAGYRSRGMSIFRYVPQDGQVTSLEDFELVMTTDFSAIDYPSSTMSPSSRTATDTGWTLTWAFDRVVTSRGIGMVMPERIQPGQLATSLTLSAPISLFFFFLVVYVLSVLRNIELHPINYLFVAGAFFAFHLLFGYSADHLPVEYAFALSSVVSVALVVSYLRLVVGERFAFVEAGLAQLVYLVGFSLAYFQDGYTGLTITVLSIGTLFLLMQWTGRIRWSEVLMKPQPKVAPAAK